MSLALRNGHVVATRQDQRRKERDRPADHKRDDEVDRKAPALPLGDSAREDRRPDPEHEQR